MLIINYNNYREQPKLCFSATFVKGQSKPMDYFVCKTCNGTTCKL